MERVCNGRDLFVGAGRKLFFYFQFCLGIQVFLFADCSLVRDCIVVYVT